LIGFKPKIMAHKALNVANEILKLSNPEIGDIISNLKLQKLLYYVQGFHIAMKDEPLFDEDIIAWQYGPVVPEVYHEFKCFGSGAIAVPDSDTDFGLSNEQLDLIKDVYEVYGQFSAVKLMKMTHEESPWTKTPISGVISPNLLNSHFKTQLVED
jgi:uncharacterized phage-associated protein